MPASHSGNVVLAFVSLPLALALCPASIAHAQGTSGGESPDRARVEEALRSMIRGKSVSEVAVSPDGKQLAWIEGGRSGGQVLVAPIEDVKRSRRVTAGSKPDQRCLENGIAWEPDSKALLFFSDCAHPDEQDDLYLERFDGSLPHRLTELTGYVHDAAFSRDGSKIAFLYVKGGTRQASALAAEKPPSGVIGEDDVEVERVAVMATDAAAPATPTQVTPPNLHVYEFDWAPDSKGLAYIAGDPPGENNWWVAKLYTEALGAVPKVVLDPSTVDGPLRGLQVALPRWSPDGKWIAFIGGLMSDQGSTGGDVWLVPGSGGVPKDLTGQRPTSPAWVEWDGNQRLFVTELAGGNSRLMRVHLEGIDGGNDLSRISAIFDSPVFSFPGTVGDGRAEMSLSSTADHSMFIFHASTFDRPTEVYAAKPGVAMTSARDGATQLSHFNDGLEPAWGKSVSLSWRSDQFRVQGWLMLPKNYDAAKTYPLIVEVHGGPASAVIPRWGGTWGLSPAAFSAMGYFVLQPNPRGSYGQGEEFTEANRKDFGYGDLRDILAGVDAAALKYRIDPKRVGITGWSYGGFMTMFALTQTSRFRAAVAGAGIADWKSYYGENSIDQWMIPYFGASVYDDPAVYARSSAIDFIKRVRTPTLVVVGDRDGECPAPQSFEFWHALRDEHVPTELVVYPNEGHGFVDPAHRRDVIERAVEWFDKYMPAASQSGVNQSTR